MSKIIKGYTLKNVRPFINRFNKCQYQLDIIKQVIKMKAVIVIDNGIKIPCFRF